MLAAGVLDKCLRPSDLEMLLSSFEDSVLQGLARIADWFREVSKALSSRVNLGSLFFKTSTASSIAALNSLRTGVPKKKQIHF